MKKWTSDDWLIFGSLFLLSPLALAFFVVIVNFLIYLITGYNVFPGVAKLW